MAEFGQRSQRVLATLDVRLQEFLRYAILLDRDFSVIEGYRGEALQESYFDKGLTQLHYPNSLHNKTDPEGKPASLAVHLLPYPFDGSIWNDRERLSYFAGWILSAGAIYFSQTHPEVERMTWGGDWDYDGFVHDNNFDDLTHFELSVKKGV